jgi:hypothetical protein
LRDNFDFRLKNGKAIHPVLALEDFDGGIARIRESRPIAIAETNGGTAKRKPLPDHLPREDIVLDISGNICGCRGGALHAIGESVSEMLDWVPAVARRPHSISDVRRCPDGLAARAGGRKPCMNDCAKTCSPPKESCTLMFMRDSSG